VVVHDLRARKTGPPWGWVAVLRCKAHERSFTAYPPGHCPYGRVPLVDLALDGGRLGLEPGDDPLLGTLLAATADAARGKLWPRTDAPSPPDAVRSTQRRRIGGAAVLLGLLADLDPKLVAEAAQVPAAVLAAASLAVEQARGLQAGARQIKGALERLLSRPSPWLCDRLAILGFLAGCWGRPYRWTLKGGGRLIALGQPFWGAVRREGVGTGCRDGPDGLP
jgi:hypothetical protein